MKLFKTTTVFLFIMALAACTSRSNSSSLMIQADSIMATSPDSALRILQDIPLSQLKIQADTAYYYLLLTQAQYKNYIILTNDSLIQKAVSYYKRIDDIPMLAKAYYYWGCALTDMKEYAHAIKAYHTASKLAEKVSDEKLLGFIYSGIAYIYQNQGMSSKADSVYQLTEQLAIRTNDSILWSGVLIRRGIYNISLGKEFYSRAEEQLLQAYAISNKKKLVQAPSSAAVALSTLYSRIPNGEKAVSFARKFLAMQQNDSTELSRGYLLLGDAYFKLGEYDSASIYLHKSLAAEDYVIKESAYMQLAGIARIRKDFEQALKWEELRRIYSEKRHKALQKTEIAVIEREIELKQDEGVVHSGGGVVLIGVIAIISVGCILIYALLLIRQKRKDIEVPFVQEDVQVDYHQRTLEFALFRVEIQSKDYWLKMMDIFSYYDKYGEYEKHFGKMDKAKFLQDVDLLLNNYTARLLQKYPLLNDKDVFFCCLCLLELSDTQLGIIIKRDRSSIYRRKKRILTDKMNSSEKRLENELLSV